MHMLILSSELHDDPNFVSCIEIRFESGIEMSSTRVTVVFCFYRVFPIAQVREWPCALYFLNSPQSEQVFSYALVHLRSSKRYWFAGGHVVLRALMSK